jgi:hypothetical protein
LGFLPSATEYYFVAVFLWCLFMVILFRTGGRPKIPLTQELLKEHLHYDTISGVFTWKLATSGRNLPGSIAGVVSSDTGYRLIGLFNKRYRAHHLAYLYVYGYLPKTIDHINGIRSDNRLINLRECTTSQNMQNAKVSSNCLTGVKGLTRCVKPAKSICGWAAELCVNGIRYRKFFSDRKFKGEEIAKQLAIDWLRNTRKLHCGEFTNHG